MKKLSFLALAAVGLLLGACADKDDTNQEAVNLEEFTDGAYIGITIQMPNTTALTRANEDFKDGDIAEWEVKNANLFIFCGGNEENAECVAHYELPTAVLDEPADDNVTATINKATRIDNNLANQIYTDKDDADVHYYAYVIVNANSMVNPDDVIGQTFGDFSDAVFNVIGSPIAAACNIGDGGLLMTNAPVSAAAGGGGAAPISAANYTTLVEIDKDKIFSSAALAEKAGNQAACVYVERAAVKITVSKKATGFANNTGLGDVTFNGWQIVNYAPSYYNTRHIDPAWGALASDYTPALSSPYLYRFVSPTEFAPKVPSAHEGPFRTYFAKDLEYNADAANLQRKKADVNGAWITMGSSGYTTENTFDVAHQTWRNTTQVAVKVTFAGGGFWTVDGNPTKLTLAQATTQLESNIKSNLSVQSKFTALINKLAAGSYTLDITVTLAEPDAGKDNVTYSAEATVKSGGSVISSFTGATDEKTALDAAVTAACSTYKASFYKGGEAYYYARIQHFGDTETPWSATKPWVVINPGSNVVQIYGVGATEDGNGDAVTEDLSTARFLGRYGVVRDNWYDIVIDEINELGSAEPIDLSGDVKDTPDDVVNNYMSVHVHIVPWVLRTQHVQF